MDYGYIHDEIKSDHYTLGALGGPIINTTGQWDVPQREIQRKNGLETMNCTNFGTNNALEILFRKQYGIVINASERYSGVMTRTKQTGNSPHNVIEIIRCYAGMVPESVLPFSDDIDTWNEYYSGVTFAMKIQGLQFIKQWDIRHEWVVNGTGGDENEKIKDALQYSPIGVAVNAWNLHNGRYFRNGGDNHWCVIVGYREGEYWLVYDSYEDDMKKLEWEFGFTRAKRYAISPRQTIDTTFIVRATQGLLGAYV